MLLSKLRFTPGAVLSDDLQAVVGRAIVDGNFQQRLLTDPKHTVSSLGLTPADKRAASAVIGASSLAEYAVLLEQRLAGQKRRRVAVGAPIEQSQRPAQRAS